MRWLRGAEGLFVTAGAAMLTWCALLVLDAGMAQRSARRSLETVSSRDTPVLHRDPAASTRAPHHDPAVAKGSAIAAISVPRIDLSAVVLHGTDAWTLRRGPGHLENTPLPGEPGNAVIAGHRDSFFLPLRNVKLGDDVFVDTPRGRVQYRVTSLRVVSPHDLSVLAPTDHDVLTLITCYPFWVLGPAPDRFIVRATRVVDPASIPVRTLRAPPIPAPDAREPREKQSFAPEEPAVPDEDLVRQAIERFRATYNARLISHHDGRPGGALRFRECDIIVAGDQAAAHCGTASQSPDDGEKQLWTSTLQRAGRGWAITSIMAN